MSTEILTICSYLLAKYESIRAIAPVLRFLSLLETRK